MKHLLVTACGVAAILCLSAAHSVAEKPAGPMPLAQVRTFMYQIQNLEAPGAIEKLAASGYDLLVVEPTFTVKGQEAFDAKTMVTKLHVGKPGRIVLAYIDIGEAENYRTYWQADWKAPQKKAAGLPDFLVEPDPDGWSGNYPVAYWDDRWQKLIATDEHSVIKQLLAAGFDGVYLDWVDAYDDNGVKATAKKQHIDTARAMVDFIGTIRQEARKLNPAALVVAQNGIYLLDADKRYLDVIDAIGFEDTWYSGKADAKWNSPKAGDIPNKYKDESSTASRLKTYARYRAAGKPVLTIDYCLNPTNATRVYTAADADGLIPLVTRVSLDQITTTPPPALKTGK